jgi:hypothetical protein
MNNFDGGPAFPYPRIDGRNTFDSAQNGMSLLDYFAGQALAGMLANPNLEVNFLSKKVDTYIERLCDEAYSISLIMLSKTEK